MATIIRIKRKICDVAMDEIDYNPKRMKLDTDNTSNSIRYFRFISHSEDQLPKLLRKMENSKAVTEIKPSIIDVDHCDILKTSEINPFHSVTKSQSQITNHFVYDYYSLPDDNNMKNIIIQLIMFEEEELDEQCYESEDNCDDENNWGNDYFDDDDLEIRCQYYEDEDPRNDSIDKFDQYDYDSDRSDKSFQNYDSDNSDDFENF